MTQLLERPAAGKQAGQAHGAQTQERGEQDPLFSVPEPPVAPPAIITQGEHETLIRQTEEKFWRLVRSPAFQDAVRLPDSVEVGGYLIKPGTHGQQADLRRQGADWRIHLDFAKQDGDDWQATEREFASCAADDYRVLVVKKGTDGLYVPKAAMRLVAPAPGRRAHSIDAIETEWGIDPAAALAATKAPDREQEQKLPVSFWEQAYDLTYVSVAEECRRGREEADMRLLITLLSIGAKHILSDGRRAMVGVMDQAIFQILAARSSRGGWGRVAGTEWKTVMSRVPDSNHSTVAIGDLVLWSEVLQRDGQAKGFYGLLLGNLLAARNVAAHGLDEQLPLPGLEPGKYVG